MRWNEMLNRGRYTEAPKPGKGTPRRFDVDDLVAMAVMGDLLAMKMGTPFTAKIANIVRITLRQDTVPDVLCLVPPARGDSNLLVTASIPPDGTVTLTLRLSDLRRKFKKLLAEPAPVAEPAGG